MHSFLTPEKFVFSKKSEAGTFAVFDFDVLKKAFFVLRSVSHPLRKRMLKLLDEHKKLTVTEIYIKLRIEQSVASQHLSVLREAGVVKTQREGKFIFYSLNTSRIAEIADSIEKLAHAKMYHV
ncbi:MAG TPA: metalloregulator ArsR/SmtB family transcription factor [Chitinophagales bacterium]|nr:metalloregulator ArsR/SmtB family transcription factor [Chitinophagales bacterium]